MHTADLLHCRDDLAGLNDSRGLQLVGVRGGDVLRAEADDVAVEVVDVRLADEGGEGGANTASLHALLHNDDLICLLDGLGNLLHIEGLERNKINHLGVVSLLLKLRNRLHHDVAHAAVREDNTVRAFADQLCLLETLHVVLPLGHPLDVVQQDVLKEDHGVVAANSGLEQGLGVLNGGAGDQLHSGDGLEVRLQTLRMLSAQLLANTARATDNNGDLELATRGVVKHTAVVRDLVEGEEQEPHVHALDNGPQSGHTGTNAHPREPVLANGGVQDTQIAVLLVKIVRHLVGAAIVPNILTHHTHGGVPLHLLIHSLAQRLPHHPLFASLHLQRARGSVGAHGPNCSHSPASRGARREARRGGGPDQNRRGSHTCYSSTLLALSEGATLSSNETRRGGG
mmetsp:Transcript_20586/g.36725  ORF Transcript_20586/g.36725 Transcript_20586/m.36725 type:complete len:398 (-) Transcript_20586:32-1225(-)